MCAVYGKGALTHWLCQKWFLKFPAGDFSLEVALQPGRPVEIDSDQIETLRTINIIPHGRYLAYSKYPNQWSYWWKWKMCLLFYRKNHRDFLVNPIHGKFAYLSSWQAPETHRYEFKSQCSFFDHRLAPSCSQFHYCHLKNDYTTDTYFISVLKIKLDI